MSQLSSRLVHYSSLFDVLLISLCLQGVQTPVQTDNQTKPVLRLGVESWRRLN